MRLKQYDQGYGAKTSKILYYLLAGAFAFIVLSIIFYIVGHAAELSDFSGSTGQTLNEDQYVLDNTNAESTYDGSLTEE